LEEEKGASPFPAFLAKQSETQTVTQSKTAFCQKLQQVLPPSAPPTAALSLTLPGQTHISIFN